ncbi:DoxX family membrane protein [Mucilaginibacter celer]|uniref:DoxX family membrane protein n=1 Tax=Mucilaginibacter celer TaxID=2305508 RepID=UPI00315DE6B6
MRILLGLSLIAKGWVIMMKFPYIRDVIMASGSGHPDPVNVNLILNSAIYSYLISGSLIFLGLMTRAAALIGLLVITASILFADFLSPFMNTDIWVNGLVMALQVQFMVIGSGPVSLDKLIGGFKFGRHRRRLNA